MSPSADVAALAESYFEAWLAVEPTKAHLLGRYESIGEFEDLSRAAEDARIAQLRDFAAQAQAIDTAGLTRDDRLTLAVLGADATYRADLGQARLAEVGADPIFGRQASLPVVLGMLAIPDAASAEAMLDKYHGVGRAFSQLADRAREGAAAGRTSPRFAVAGVIAQLDELIAATDGTHPLAAPVQLPPEVDQAQWMRQATQAIAAKVVPGLQDYREALAEQLDIARSDEKVGLSWLPQGREAYDATLQYYTTTRLSAEEIHQLGLDQVEALAAEYRQLGPQVVGSDDLETIFTALREDPALHFTHGDQLVEASRVAMARAWEQLPRWFSTLPQAPCAVEATMSGPKAYYFPPATDGSRGGTFFINVDDPASWGTFELEAMAFHEGVPGHHLQLAIAAEHEGLPAFRQHMFNSAYAEGWGLYSERLADEMGLYSTPTDRIGMLAADSMRATRLVIDTGLHALGWSRAQAVDYMLANTPLARGVVEPEVDRYIVTPGQATSYMVGRLELMRMRTAAQTRLGERFDIKAFHDAVLSQGSLPLQILDEHVAAVLQ